ncbi:pilin subunit [Bordetella pertussis]|uniref:Membrane protein n=4 Tax=Bordetella pertussis TaxID=520 RepID=Q7VX32_BORPE|nr:MULTISPECIES: Flp family type IVb pilin [Bordetella]ETH41070.1 Flp/Fap pilin component [Bordetella pertussis H918]ETH44904.1 Flp/Fap pilin component [Bordetella pertussis H939]ETH45621.1 Flp/Fap pilin component [Bordetella pertussis H921]ETH69467.1 Flp/Fap pilin component [Bordetella pertussis STO1-CHLA-0011]ETH84579.1 Flp/Fap pilin component [Bordetella pertussis STO1-CHOC-0017]ETH85377.1 Flp/Fap pilin component [Bordetella pertussis STO1-CHOC-0018]ETH91977.1 Flp/Fap pilin component [Bor
MLTQLKNFWRDEEGATAIEYGLIVGLIAVVIIGSVSLLGETLKGFFDTIQTELSAEAP